MADKSDKSLVSRPRPSKASSAVEHYFRVLDNVQAGASTPAPPEVSIANEAAREQKLKNDNAEQDIRLKRQTINRLFWFLRVETGLVFVFAFCQAVQWPGNFHLEDWSFKLLVGVTITQITAMLFAAVNYLFPKSRR